MTPGPGDSASPQAAERRTLRPSLQLVSQSVATLPKAPVLHQKPLTTGDNRSESDNMSISSSEDEEEHLLDRTVVETVPERRTASECGELKSAVERLSAQLLVEFKRQEVRDVLLELMKASIDSLSNQITELTKELKLMRKEERATKRELEIYRLATREIAGLQADTMASNTVIVTKKPLAVQTEESKRLQQQQQSKLLQTGQLRQKQQSNKQLTNPVVAKPAVASKIVKSGQSPAQKRRLQRKRAQECRQALQEQQQQQQRPTAHRSVVSIAPKQQEQSQMRPQPHQARKQGTQWQQQQPAAVNDTSVQESTWTTVVKRCLNRQQLQQPNLQQQQQQSYHQAHQQISQHASQQSNQQRNQRQGPLHQVPQQRQERYSKPRPDIIRMTAPGGTSFLDMYSVIRQATDVGDKMIRARRMDDQTLSFYLHPNVDGTTVKEVIEKCLGDKATVRVVTDMSQVLLPVLDMLATPEETAAAISDKTIP
ncbi:putative uncharacterized protein DDB_G0271606 [Anopheles funestus]|uniref:putative uncharacterized protein DDB_G0271606 n=1 Tax=Anopheles funestus TaxID=62324 RepID=UPI0020C620C8|nr:putative uncharacterized protein DDB_G0271606 [Anopheles funestus]